MLISAGGALLGLAVEDIQRRRRNERGDAVASLGPGDRIVRVTRMHGEVGAVREPDQFDLMAPTRPR